MRTTANSRPPLELWIPLSKTLKDLIASDIDLVFMQLDDFGEIHRVEGKEITIVIDNDTLATMKNGNILDVAESDMLIFAKTEDLPGEKAPGSAINIDGRECIVDLWAENLGITQITLHHSRMI